MEIEEKYMRRCIALARNGFCHTAPNPMVGAVIVCDGVIIGEGYHVQCGQAHAEVNAIRSVKRPELLSRSTLYVSLEPCSHYGKTPPCADLIIEKHIPRVVVGCMDPFEKVSGRGIQKLRDAGCEVVVGVLEAECRRLIERFLTFHQKHRPYITLKWAQTADGYIDLKRESGTPVPISSPLTQLRVHKLRAEHAAIMVGYHTARLDNPSLNVRHWSGPQPLRIVTDRFCRLSSSLHLFDGSQPTLVLIGKEQPKPEVNGQVAYPVEYVQLDDDESMLPQLMELLYHRQVQSLLVEGGARLLQSFIDASLWDEAIVEDSPMILGGGVSAPQLSQAAYVERRPCFGHWISRYERAIRQNYLPHYL